MSFIAGCVTAILLGGDVGVGLIVGVIVELGLGDTVGFVGVFEKLVIGVAAELAVQVVRVTTNTKLQIISFIIVIAKSHKSLIQISRLTMF